MGRIENHDGRAWRARAAVCRAIAETFQNPETRARMCLMADDYERMAERADQRQQEEGEATPRAGAAGRAGIESSRSGQER